MARKIVRVVHESKIIKILADPVRREILRQLRHEPQTQTQLARKLNLTKPSVKHHLQLLSKSRLIRVARSKVESHGILQKYYETTSNLFIEDYEKTPLHLQKYFLQFHIERLRGILSVFQLVGKRRGEPIKVTSHELKELAQEIARQTVKVGKRYEKTEASLNRETLLIMIYSEALEEVMNKSEWKDFFDLIAPTASRMPKASSGD
ncbi:MAG: helix-turn-helix domain-containing protein [Candidatus Bathyarchaeota archaeon]|nr:helix-turn-helix domain-containing protein [Candidatus Bathyarchaeota archaeon]